ncbi:hypothetical protein JIN86_06590 [Lysinibacillus sp. HST-98]|uniref:hypothetical protein n=1 Tax=Lysinibacillus sp. HST-98 TaxID=2800419 RepID=UPI001927859E|nr:hypothetical protein [Lysinibacillus sp. HST-98]MBL3729266.1 hypothetical protein [Lysinibacillus sp. HST-98]
MKISKIFTGLVVCGALIFPGALSSSAKEIKYLESVDSINYSAEQQEVQSITSLRVAKDWSVTRTYSTHQGPYVVVTELRERPAPYAPYVYKGTLMYDANRSSLNNFVYEGTLYLQ